MSDDPDLLIARYLDGQASVEEVQQLDDAIRDDPALRQRFVAQAGLFGLLSEGLRGGAIAPLAASGPSAGRGAGPRSRAAAGPRSSARPWPRRAAVATGVLALVVALFWATRSPPIESVATGAQLVAWHGAATLRRGEAAQPLVAGLALVVGDRLDTGVTGRIELAWPDGSHATIASSSLAALSAPAGAPTLTLERGRVEVEVAQRLAAPALAIVVGEWRIVHLGTVFTVATGDGPRVQVREGSVAIHATNPTNPTSAPTLIVRAGQVAAPDVAGRPHLRWDQPVLAYATPAHPFAANSPWNAPISPGAARTAFSTVALTTLPWTTTASRIRIVTGAESRIDVVLAAPGKPPGRATSVPGFDPDLVAAADFLVVLDPDGRRAWELYEAKLVDQRVTAQRMEVVDLRNAGTTGSIQPAGYPAYAGLIQGDELQTGIHHALSLFMTEAMLSATGVRLGDRLALPEDFVVPTGTGTQEIEPEVVSALRRHGALVVGVALKPQVGVDSRLPPEVHARVAASVQRLAPHLQRVR